jgi:uncharacterized protein
MILPILPQSSALDEVTAEEKTMDRTNIAQVAEEALAQRQEHAAREPDWLLHHGRRTARLALWLCDEMQAEVDRDTLYMGTLLHDIGKGQEPHNETGAAMTSTLLSTLCTPIELQEICELIRGHTRYGQADLSVAAKLVQDADILDHVGAIDVWLAFYWSGAHHETVADHIRFIQGEDNTRYRAKLRALLNFVAAQRLFDERIAFEDAFFAQFHRVYHQGL